ncbi:hypothetical protein GIB67_036445 [Kingdonia uniflora]|uniref:Peptidase S54 rhomboid domain-containing protein n=1 Tax=Kingdonia uniflora TaxID=39325 RepID=A0A7J7L4C7_9MAGN|nr:hypothetical protein GIB67_036445 [Kingdonia uniflora]
MDCNPQILAQDVVYDDFANHGFISFLLSSYQCFELKVLPLGSEKRDAKRLALGASAAVYSTVILQIFLRPRSIASAIVYSSVIVELFLHPRFIHHLNLLIPIPEFILVPLLFTNDIMRAIEGDTGSSDVAHLGGAVVGALAWVRVRKRLI